MQSALVAGQAAGIRGGGLGRLAGGVLDREVFPRLLSFVGTTGSPTVRHVYHGAVDSGKGVPDPSEFFVPTLTPQEKLKANLGVLERWGMSPEVQNRVRANSRTFTQLSAESLEAKLRLLSNEVGLGKRQVIRVVENCHSYLDRPPTKTLEPVLELLRSGGVSEPDIRKLILKKPLVLGGHDKLRLVCGFMERELGIALKAFLELLVRFPQMMGYHVEQNLQKKVDYFLDLGVSRVELGAMVVKYPQLMGMSLENNIKSKIDTLVSEGISKEEVIKTFVRAPQLMGRKLSTLLDKIKGLQHAMEISGEEAFALLNRNLVSFDTPGPRWTEVQNAMVSAGLSPAEAAKISIREAKVLRVACADLIEKIKFAKFFLGKTNRDLMFNTRYFTASFQDKIFFRAVFLDAQGQDITKVKLPALIKSDAAFFKPYDKTLVDNFRSKWHGMSQPERLAAIVAKSCTAMEKSEV